MNFRFSPSLLSQAALAVLAAASLSAHADTAAGMRVSRDGTTGQLRAPTPEESQALDAAKGRSAAKAPVGMLTGRVNPQPIYHADGTVEQELDESTLSYSVVRRGADGKMEMYCVTGNEAAQRIVKGQKPAIKAAKSVKEHQHDQ
jgi:hypothetical protein